MRKLTAKTLLERALESGLVFVPGIIPWSLITPSVDGMLDSGRTCREIWNWLVDQGVPMPASKYRNFEVSVSRRKNRPKRPAKKLSTKTKP